VGWFFLPLLLLSSVFEFKYLIHLLLSSGETVVQDLFDVVNHAIEHPLDGDFDLSPQGKAV
jgi:hypothetical protein